MSEVAVDVITQTKEGDFFDFNGHGARFDLRKVKNIINQVEQIGTRRIDILGKLDLLGQQVSARVAC